MRFRASFVFFAALLLASGAFGQAAMTVGMLSEFIRNAVKEKMQDKEVAQYLATVKLKQKLDADTVERLQEEGAGKLTVGALKKLMATSAALTPAPDPTSVPAAPTYADLHPAPAYDDQYRIINEARERAMNYTQTLPNFICLQQTRRSYDRHYQAGTEGAWAQSDVLNARVSYFNQKEEYKLLGVNDNPVINKEYDQVGGAISRGEFGSLLKEVFDPSTQTEFHWLRWGSLNKQLCHVYQYKVEQEHSRWTVDYQKTDQVTPAYQGLVYVDTKSKVVLRVTLDAIMPPTFPIQEVKTQLDYRYQDVSGQQFLLPTYSEVKMRHDHTGTLNQISFRGFRRYSADTSITFADVDGDIVVPETEEKPAAGKPATKPVVKPIK